MKKQIILSLALMFTITVLWAQKDYKSLLNEHKKSIQKLHFDNATTAKTNYFNDEIENAFNRNHSIELRDDDELIWVKDSVISFRWDKDLLYWYLYEKNINQYDSKGNDTLNFIYRRDSELDVWKKRSKWVHINNANGDPLENTYYSWNNNLNSWKNSYKTIFDYDSYGNKIEILDLKWNTTISDWENISKYTTVYDINGNKIEIAIYYWNTELNNWKGNSKQEYTFNLNNNPTELNKYSWNNELYNWKKNSRIVYSYDENENLIEELILFREFSSQTMVKFQKHVYSYNNTGQKVEDLVYNWKPDYNEFQLSGKFVYTYNEEGKIIKYLEAGRDNTLNIWIPIIKADYSYFGNTKRQINFFKNISTNTWRKTNMYDTSFDANENMTEFIEYSWSSLANDWRKMKKYLRTYDSYNNPTEYSDMLWSDELNDWTGGFAKDIVYWSSIAINVNTPSDSQTIKIFPNPTSGNVNFTSKQLKNKDFRLEVLDLNGLVLFSKKFDSGNTDYTIDLSGFSQGMYLLRVQGDGFMGTEKVIIK